MSAYKPSKTPRPKTRPGFGPNSTERCRRTGNPCGTDTHTKGVPCECPPCLRFMEAECDRLRAERNDAETALVGMVSAFDKHAMTSDPATDSIRGRAAEIIERMNRRE